MAKILLDFKALSPRKNWSKAEDEYTRRDKEDDSFKPEVASFDKCKETKRVKRKAFCDTLEAMLALQNKIQNWHDFGTKIKNDPIQLLNWRILTELWWE